MQALSCKVAWQLWPETDLKVQGCRRATKVVLSQGGISLTLDGVPQHSQLLPPQHFHSRQDFAWPA